LFISKNAEEKKTRTNLKKLGCLFEAFLAAILIDMNKINVNDDKNWFKNINIEFLKKRKLAYIVSGAIIAFGLVSILTIGLKQGVDFKGGRSYIVRFDKPVKANEVAATLKDAFGTAPETM
jgi:hypothetical protein